MEYGRIFESSVIRSARAHVTRYFHNGDGLTGRTVQVPTGRPPTGEPPFTWGPPPVDPSAAESPKATSRRERRDVQVMPRAFSPM